LGSIEENDMSSDSQIRVVLVDDHAVVRAGIRQFLERASDIQIVGEAEDGEEAKAVVLGQQPDVAVLDIRMPKMSGIELTRWLRSNYRKVGVLVLTAYDDDPYVLTVLQAGANGYVLKTASPRDIIQAVRDVYAGKSALDAVIAQKLVAQIAKQADENPAEKLSDRELEVLSMTARGFTNKAIGVQLGISDRTVQGHLAHIFNKLQVGSRTEAVMRAVSLGWIPQDIAAGTEE
jgi:DNA-binding NarL/FixJ family response regulator